jgi:nucleoside-diphosphate-sugar epimerase
MRVFITGASGWIGSAVTDELLANGHEVVGLARSDASAASLEAKGATVRRGDLDDLDGIHRSLADAEAVIHLANKHDFANPAVSNLAERNAVETIGEALAGSDRPFLFASGLARPAGGGLLTENDLSQFHGLESPRGGAENRALEFVEQGVTVVSSRFAPTTHGAGDNGFMAAIVAAAKATGISGYPGDGDNSWGAVHRTDAARAVRLGLEQATPGLIIHAVAEQAIPTREIAEVIGRGLGIPVQSIASEDAVAHFGFIGMFFGMEISASNALTRERLGWTPTGPTLTEDLDSGVYYR